VSNDIKNPLLARQEDQIESQLTPETKDNYLRIVTVGLQTVVGSGPNGIVAQLKSAPDPLTAAAQGAVSLVFILRKEAKGVMPPKAMVYASFTLMLYALDYLDSHGIMKIGNPELVQATHIWTNFIMKLSKITPQVLAQMTQRVHAITKDPAAMHAVNLKAGIASHTDVPPGAPPAPAPGGPLLGMPQA
jgi:hypothetical protein